MKYPIEFKPTALKDLKKLDKQEQKSIIEKTESLQNNLSGDVKHLTNFTPNTGSGSGIIEYCLKSRPVK